MNEKWTEGPWTFEDRGPSHCVDIRAVVRGWSVTPVRIAEVIPFKNCLETAALISAAPEMYEALKKCAVAFSALYPATLIIRRNAEHENEEIVVADLLAEIRAALSKANGAQQEVERG